MTTSEATAHRLPARRGRTEFILVSFIVYAPATVLFVMARREQGKQLFSSKELVIVAVSVIGAASGVIALATGAVTI